MPRCDGNGAASITRTNTRPTVRPFANSGRKPVWTTITLPIRRRSTPAVDASSTSARTYCVPYVGPAAHSALPEQGAANAELAVAAAAHLAVSTSSPDQAVQLRAKGF